MRICLKDVLLRTHMSQFTAELISHKEQYDLQNYFRITLVQVIHLNSSSDALIQEQLHLGREIQMQKHDLQTKKKI